jgi:hypothetical protein
VSRRKAWFDSCRTLASDSRVQLTVLRRNPSSSPGRLLGLHRALEPRQLRSRAPPPPPKQPVAGAPPSLLSGRGLLRGGGYLLKGYVRCTPSREPNRLRRHRASPRRGIAVRERFGAPSDTAIRLLCLLSACASREFGNRFQNPLQNWSNNTLQLFLH